MDFRLLGGGHYVLLLEELLRDADEFVEEDHQVEVPAER